jgi:glutamate dehydrogenase
LVIFEQLYSALDIVEIAAETKRSVTEVAGAYFGVGGRLQFSWLRNQVDNLPGDSHWQTLARTGLREDVSRLQTEITTLVLKLSPDAKTPDTLINEWEAQNEIELERTRQFLADLHSGGKVDLSMLSVALRELRNLAHSSAKQR